MQIATLDPIPAVLAGASPAGSRGLSESPWRLLLLVVLPYWAVFSTLSIISSELFASGGDLAYRPRMLGITLEVRVVQNILMTIVALGAYRLALAIGWPEQRRWLAALKHLGLALAIAYVSRPLFVLAVKEVLDERVDWLRVFLPRERGLKLWGSMGIEFLLPYLLGLALIVGIHVWTALQRSELERANLRSAWTQARLQALRMQLNPHFLFNTFNTIATLLEADPQPARARTLVLALSDLYRRTLIATEREWTPLSEELALADDYLRIQAARFDGRLTYEIECDPELSRHEIPALLLQPLVENAVAHGVDDNRRSLRIWIKVECSPDDTLRVEVGNATDGALGASPGAGIGLRNTRTRLAACYGGRAAMETGVVKPGCWLSKIAIPLRGSSDA